MSEDEERVAAHRTAENLFRVFLPDRFTYATCAVSCLVKHNGFSVGQVWLCSLDHPGGWWYSDGARHDSMTDAVVALITKMGAQGYL